MSERPLQVQVNADGTGFCFRAAEREQVKRWAGQWVVIRRVAKRRSLEQNAWIWGVAYPLIAKTLGYDYHEYDDLHYALIAKCFGAHLDERLGTNVPNARSSQLTTTEFSEYMEWLVRVAAQEWDCVIPLPGEA